MLNLNKETLISRDNNSAAAGTTTINGTVLDMSGYDGVLFAALLGTLTATQVTSLKIQAGTLSDGSDMADVTGTTAGPALDADSNKLLISELFRPQKRYVRAVLVRGTANAVLDGILAVRYRAAKRPVALDTTVSAAALAVN